MIRNRHAASLAMAMVVSLALPARADRARQRVVDADQAFERLKSLVGRWEGRSPRGGTARVTYELVSGGSVLVERFGSDDLPGGGAMLTTYYLDGTHLMLTHYCLAKNQPRLRAERFDPARGELEFVFAGATNLTDPRAGHMRRATFYLEDAGHFTSEWEFWEDGRLAFRDRVRYTRVR
jgi:hypothetical protein